jgi:hypothetical protein
MFYDENDGQSRLEKRAEYKALYRRKVAFRNEVGNVVRWEMKLGGWKKRQPNQAAPH